MLLLRVKHVISGLLNSSHNMPSLSQFAGVIALPVS